MSAIAGRVSRFSYRNLAISSVETSTPVGCRGAAPRRDAEGDEQNQNDGGVDGSSNLSFFCSQTVYYTKG